MAFGLHHSPWARGFRSSFVFHFTHSCHEWCMTDPGSWAPESMSEGVPAPEGLLLVSWLTHLYACRDCSLKKAAGTILMGAKWTVGVGGCLGFASIWPRPNLVSVPTWFQHWVREVAALLWPAPWRSLLVLWNFEGVHFKLAVALGLVDPYPFFCHLDFLFSFSFHLKRCKLSEPLFPLLSNRDHNT